MILTPIPSLTPLTTEVKCIVDSIQCDTIDNNRRSARTTLLLCRRICAPPELSIKIFQSDYFLFDIALYQLHC